MQMLPVFYPLSPFGLPTLPHPHILLMILKCFPTSRRNIFMSKESVALLNPLDAEPSSFKSLSGNQNSPITLLDVKLIPSQENCLLSIGRLEAAGGHAVFKNGSCSLYMKGKLTAKGKHIQHLYELNVKTIFPIESVSVANQSRQLSWNEAHRTLGHLSLTSMKKIFQNELITGIHVDPNVTPEIQCESCIQSKAARKPFPHESPNQAKQLGDLTHTDIWGPA